MKRCEFCNDVLVKGPNEKHYNGEIVECFICGTQFKVTMKWKTIINENGMLKTLMLPKLSLL